MSKEDRNEQNGAPPVDDKAAEVTGALLDRRKVFKQLAILAGATTGVVGVGMSRHALAENGQHVKPSDAVCSGSFWCGLFQCAAPFGCSGFSCTVNYSSHG